MFILSWGETVNLSLVMLFISIISISPVTASVEINTDLGERAALVSLCSPHLQPDQIHIQLKQPNFSPAENIIFSICNNTAHTILISMDCTPFELQYKQSTLWQIYDLPCLDETLQLWAIASHNYLIISLVPTENPTSAIVASAPVSPIIYEGDLRDLPAPPTWQPGDPVREVPKGGVPSLETDANTQIGEFTLLSLVTTTFESGIYRLVVCYTLQTDNDDIALTTVYSENFTITSK